MPGIGGMDGRVQLVCSKTHHQNRWLPVALFNVARAVEDLDGKSAISSGVAPMQQLDR